MKFIRPLITTSPFHTQSNSIRFPIYSIALTFFFFLLTPTYSNAQSLTDSLDLFIAKQVKDYKLPGLAIGIIHNNKVLFKKGYGVISTTDPFPVTTETVFPLSSNTKAFTAAAMGVLVDEGKINWNDKVIKYLPDFKLSDPWITKELTISDILSHRSGLNSFDGDLLWYGTNYSRKELVRKIQYLPIRGNFRVDFGYQNLMYLVAGIIIETVSHLSYEEFVKEKLFNPLLMKHTTTSHFNNNYAQPHLINKPIKPIDMTNLAPAGGINSTIDDLMRWMQMWMGNGRINDTIVINENSFETITSIKTFTSTTTERGYGFGWYIDYREGEKILYHDGGMPGYQSSIIWFPKRGDAIIILTNKISPINGQLINMLTGYLNNTDSINWNEADHRMSRKGTVYSWDKERERVKLFSGKILGLLSYEGQYEDSVYGKANIKTLNGRMIIELLPTKELFTSNLYFVEENKFRIVFNDGFIPEGEIIFGRDKNKKVKGFKLNIDTNDFHFDDLNFQKIAGSK